MFFAVRSLVSRHPSRRYTTAEPEKETRPVGSSAAMFACAVARVCKVSEKALERATRSQSKENHASAGSSGLFFVRSLAVAGPGLTHSLPSPRPGWVYLESSRRPHSKPNRRMDIIAVRNRTEKETGCHRVPVFLLRGRRRRLARSLTSAGPLGPGWDYI